MNNRPVTRLRTAFFSRTKPDPTQKTREEIPYRMKRSHNNPFTKSETLFAEDAVRTPPLTGRNVHAIEIISGALSTATPNGPL